MNNDKMVSVPFKALRDFLEHSACTYKGPEWTKNKAALRHAMNHAEQTDVIREMNDELVDLRARMAGRDVLLRESLEFIDDGVGRSDAEWKLILKLRAALSASAELSAPKLSVWYGSMPESNGKTNWTAILHRGDITEGITIDRSEYPGRVRYEADRFLHMIGELSESPCVLDYDTDKHSEYKP
jgi:hypothetical protein